MSPLSREFLDLQSALAGEYSLERELGRGGMGVVLLARDVQLDRYVAIKVLAAHLTADLVFRDRLLREARTAAGLSHPNIVPIHRVGEAAGFVFFVMSYVPGETLGERLRTRGPLRSDEAVRIVREVAWALAYAHGRGIVHRDIKPDNILLEEGTGRALVTDFGIARVGVTSLSEDPGAILGTAHFMSPEQAMSAPVDGRSDLYSLGIVAYVAVSGRLPFEGSNVPALLLQQVNDPPPSVTSIAPGTPQPLASAIHRCLEKERHKRFATGEELAAALAPASDGRPALAAPLRTWLAERNPATVFYAAWSGLLGLPMMFVLGQFLNYRRAGYLIDTLRFGVLALVPLAPMLGFHVNRARRLFRAGFTLADIRIALNTAEVERREAEALDAEQELTPSQYGLRVTTYATFLTTTILTFMEDAVRLFFERRHVLLGFERYQLTTGIGWLASLVLLAMMNVDQVPVLPRSVRQFFRGGLRDRLWRSRLGEFLARQLGAPTISRPMGAGAFQATELALGGAVIELFAGLPQAYREQLHGFEGIVDGLERRARDARAELEVLDRLDQHTTAADDLAARRDAAKTRLARNVAALESIRVDLVRLHAGAVDLTSLTTLLEDAQRLGEDLARLTEAQIEIKQVLPSSRPDGLYART